MILWYQRKAHQKHVIIIIIELIRDSSERELTISEGSLSKKDLRYLYMFQQTCYTFTCFLGVKISRNFSAFLRRTIFSLNFNLIPGVRYKFFNMDLSSSRYSLVFFTVEIYNDLCYITGVFRCCTYSPRHKCCTFVWCNVNSVYRSWSLN